MEPVLSREEIRAVDRLAVEEYALPGIVLMENAGAGAARWLLEEAPRRVAIPCGPGNNGGDGYVVARHLANAGVEVRVLELAAPERSGGDAGIAREVARRMAERGALRRVEAWEGAPSGGWNAALEGCDWLVDALLGTGATGEVREPLAAAVRALNAAREAGARVLALDVPSGLDAETGSAARDTVRADRTAIFAARKRGLEAPGAEGYTGEVRVVPIGVPVELLARVARGRPGR